MNLLETKEGREIFAASLARAIAVDNEPRKAAYAVIYLEHARRAAIWSDGHRVFEDVHDPAKLAEFLVSESRRLGLEAGLRLREHKDGEPLVYPWEFLHFPNPSVPNAKPGIGICPNHWDVDVPERDLNMPEARAALAAFLQLSDGDTAGAEKILRGNQ